MSLHFRLLSILLLSILFVSLSASGQSVDDGRDAANRGDFRKAREIWLPLADKNNADAQFNLGRLFARGDGVKKNFKEAYSWFKRAAAQGHIKACEKLSLMYHYGDGVEKNENESRAWKINCRGLGEVPASNSDTTPASAIPIASATAEQLPVSSPLATTSTEPSPLATVASIPSPTPVPTSSESPVISPTVTNTPLPTPSAQPTAESSATAGSSLPEGTIQAGSLCNQKLVQDAMVGVAAKVALAGCSKPENMHTYIVKLPQGKEGSRVWEEKWIVNGCGTTYPFNIEFSEDGMNAANYVVK